MSGYAAIGLVAPKCNANVGGVMRAAMCYQASLVAIQGGRYRRESSDTTAAYRTIPLIHCDELHSVVPFDCVPVAIEFFDDARSLVDFTHPKRAFYVFGPEDGSLGEKTTQWCKHIVYVPTSYCMNLAATANVVLYDRLAKQRREIP